jgi:hypothetical protein
VRAKQRHEPSYKQLLTAAAAFTFAAALMAAPKKLLASTMVNNIVIARLSHRRAARKANYNKFLQDVVAVLSFGFVVAEYKERLLQNERKLPQLPTSPVRRF